MELIEPPDTEEKTGIATERQNRTFRKKKGGGGGSERQTP
jgi:hypothetical protein